MVKYSNDDFLYRMNRSSFTEDHPLLRTNQTAATTPEPISTSCTSIADTSTVLAGEQQCPIAIGICDTGIIETIDRHCIDKQKDLMGQEAHFSSVEYEFLPGVVDVELDVDVVSAKKSIGNENSIRISSKIEKHLLVTVVKVVDCPPCGCRMSRAIMSAAMPARISTVRIQQQQQHQGVQNQLNFRRECNMNAAE